jgi:CubicO group peptidase (beta-lactamase class C family)
VSKSRLQTFVAVIVAGIGLLVAGIMGLFAYRSLTAKPLHPDPQIVPAAIVSAPSAEWSRAAERAREVVRAGLAEQNLPGISVAVGAGGRIVWAEAMGFANLEPATPVTPDTRFRIGTASTALTSAAVGLLLEQGRLKLDDEIQTYVPGFPKKEWPVTLRHLMGHVAGIRNDGGDEGPLYGQQCDRPADALPAFADRPLLFQPGTKFRYSSYGWILMSAAVEEAADESFLRVMRDRIFEPLGMEDTRADSISEPIANLAIPYFPKFAADPRYGPDPMRPVDYSCYAGASVFVSTPSDLVRFALAVDGGTLLKPETVQLLQTSLRLSTGEETGYGLGWDLETATLNGTQARVVGHDGDSLGGRVASLMMFRDQGIVVAVIANTSYADTFAIGAGVAQAFADATPGPPPARK